jgi:hypothetical protein
MIPPEKKKIMKNKIKKNSLKAGKNHKKVTSAKYCSVVLLKFQSY